MKNLFLKVYCGLLLYGNCLYAQHTSVFSQEKAARIDSFLTVMHQYDMFNGSMLVAEHGKIVYERSTGYIDLEHKIPNTDTSHFNLASVSKPFTAIAVLQLIQKRKLNLSDPLTKYFADFPYPAVTIRHLLTHTGGLPVLEDFTRQYINEHPDEIITSEKAYAILVALKQPLKYQPGNKWAYSNLGYIILAMLVEKISNMPFATYMKKNVFLPAGMKTTYIRGYASPNTPRYIIPTMYETAYKNVDSLDHTIIYTHYNLGGNVGPSNVVSTLRDLLNFDNALSAGKLLNASLLKEAFTPVILNNGDTFHMGKGPRSYGFGWNVMQQASKDTVVFHDGHIIGLTTMLYKNLSKDLSIIFYNNNGDFSPFQYVGTVSRILNDEPLNKTSLAKSLARIYGEALVNKGIDYATVKFNELKSDTINYYIDELELNSLGYDLGKANFAGHNELALEVFKINTLLYPKSANTYDSYAEVLAKIGKKEEAISMYKKSLLLNPRNTDGQRALQKLSAQDN